MTQYAHAQGHNDPIEQSWSGSADLLDANGDMIASVAADL